MLWSSRSDETKRYEIRIAGPIGDELAPYVENMTSVVHPTETVLHGDIADQAALHGLLERLHSLGLELIELRSISDPG